MAAPRASRLHLDLDGPAAVSPPMIVRAITAALSIPVQLGGGVRSLDEPKPC